MTPAVWVWAADAVLILHFAFVSFVVGGLVMIVVGNLCSWRFVNQLWFRLLHLAMILVVMAEAWLGIVCPLTALESELRLRAGGDGYSTSFIEHWLGTILFFDLPPFVFVGAYTLFGVLVIFTWWKYPPHRRIEHA